MTRPSTGHVALAAAALCATLTAGVAAAHARLIGGDPARGATVTAPRTITLHFSEKVVARFSGLELRKADGALTPVKLVAAADAKSVMATVGSPLPAGVYKVTWRAAAADDGHRTTGEYAFTVR